MGRIFCQMSRFSICLVLLVGLAAAAKRPRFSGMSVLVTGGSSGIGKATAKQFAAECASTIHIVSRAHGQLLAARNEILQVNRSMCESHQFVDLPLQPRQAILQNSTLNVVIHVVDMSNLTQVTQMMESIDDLDVAVNSAGIGGRSGNLADLPDNVWHSVHDAIHNNVYATLFGVQSQVRHFIKNNKTSAAIVNLASTQGLTACAGCAMYSASKHAVVGITQSVALEVATLGIRVNAVAPGLVETPLTWNQARELMPPPIPGGPSLQSFECVIGGKVVVADFTCDEGCVCNNIAPTDPYVQQIRDGYMQVAPIKRTAQPEEIANVVLALASEDSSYMMGTVVPVDGGCMAQGG